MTAVSREPFVIARIFDAPRDLVWRTHTEPALIEASSGVAVEEHDFRPGGVLRYRMGSADGPGVYGRQAYREIHAPDRLVFLVSFTDSAGTVIRHPMSPTWPLETLSTVTLIDQGGQTELRIEWIPFNATDEEYAVFDAARDGMAQGWDATLDQLAAYLATAKA